MEISRDIWVGAHGSVLGGLLLIAFAAGLVGFFRLRAGAVGIGEGEIPRTIGIGTSTMAVVAWLAVIVGTYLVYVWYRDPAATSPRSILLADPATAALHTFGMEWKEHVAWLSPMLATVVAFAVMYYGRALANEHAIRRAATALFVTSFLAAAVAAVVGGLLSQAAPIV